MKVKASLKLRTVGGKGEKIIKRNGVRYIIPTKTAGIKAGRLKVRTPISRRKKLKLYKRQRKY
jgi:ribosomal protein L36